MSDWIDPDDAPELTEEFFRHAEIRVGGKLIRAATGLLTKDGVRPISPAKRQVRLAVDSEVVDRFRAQGRDWQNRMNAVLREAVGL